MKDDGTIASQAEQPLFIGAVFTNRIAATAAMDVMKVAGIDHAHIIYTEHGPDDDAEDCGLLGFAVRSFRNRPPDDVRRRCNRRCDGVRDQSDRYGA